MWSLCIMLLMSSLVKANTEAYSFQIPNYYNIPIHSQTELQNNLIPLNSTSWLLKDHPILTIDGYNADSSVLTIPYNYTSKSKQQLFVKVNNYNNSVFNSNDLINVKLCWPATIPINFQIGHKFIQERFFYGLNSTSAVLDMYIVVDFQADFYSIKPLSSHTFEILLAVSKLPNRVPIPIELYDVIVHIVDLMILASVVLPWVLKELT